MRRATVLAVLVACLAVTNAAIAAGHYCGHGSRGLWRTETFVQTVPGWMYADSKHRHLVMRSSRMGSSPTYVTPVCGAHR